MRKPWKKAGNVLLAAAIAVTTAGYGAIPVNAAEETTITVWSWDASLFESIEEGYNIAHPDAPIKFDIITVASEDYLTKLQQCYVTDSDLPDLLVAEMSSRAAEFQVDVWENLEEDPYNIDTGEFYDYELGCMRNAAGNVVAVENAQNPAAMGYKRDLAKEYLGTDDREEIEKMFQTYEDYVEIGKEVYEKSEGKVTLFASLRDVSDMMLNQKRDIKNEDEDGNVVIEEKASEILKTVEAIRDNNAAGNLTEWSAQWTAAFGQSNNIFFPMPQWMITYMVKPNDPNGSGNWGLCVPAEGGYGAGGTCYGVSKTSDVKEKVWDVIHWNNMTEEGAKWMWEKREILCASITGLQGLDIETPDEFFGGQSVMKVYADEVLPNIAECQMSVYDSVISESLGMVVEAMNADHSITADAALESFLSDVKAKIPDHEVK